MKYRIKNIISRLRSSISKNRRDITLRKLYKQEYLSLDEFFDNCSLKTGIHTIWFDNIPLDLLFQYNSQNKPLIVFFHGAVDQSRTAIPHFVGLSYRRLVDANLLHISDSSLIYDEDIRAGWYMGCGKIKLQEVMQEIAIFFSKKLETNRIIFFGSSGGGYPALYLSQVIPNSMAIVNSPATSVRNHPHRSSHVSQYIKSAFGAKNEKDEENILNNQVVSDLRRDFDAENSTILYMINVNDKNNIEHHSNQFLEQFLKNIKLTEINLKRINNIYIFTDDWGEGHRYPDSRLLIDIFAYVTNKENHWPGEKFEQFLKNKLTFNQN